MGCGVLRSIRRQVRLGAGEVACRILACFSPKAVQRSGLPDLPPCCFARVPAVRWDPDFPAAHPASMVSALSIRSSHAHAHDSGMFGQKGLARGTAVRSKEKLLVTRDYGSLLKGGSQQVVCSPGEVFWGYMSHKDDILGESFQATIECLQTPEGPLLLLLFSQMK